MHVLQFLLMDLCDCNLSSFVSYRFLLGGHAHRCNALTAGDIILSVFIIIRIVIIITGKNGKAGSLGGAEPYTSGLRMFRA